MEDDISVTGLRAYARKIAIERAGQLSGAQCELIWRTQQILAANGSLEGIAAPTIRFARDLNYFPEAWKIVAKKALAYQSAHRTDT